MRSGAVIKVVERYHEALSSSLPKEMINEAIESLP
jgi:hypothetical protein